MDFTFSFTEIADLKKFLEAVKTCENEVYFESADGDRLSLRSALCRLILYSICCRREQPKNAVIRCYGEHDRQLLVPYFKNHL